MLSSRKVSIVLIVIVLSILAAILLIQYVIPELTNSKIILIDDSILGVHFQRDPVEMRIGVKNDKNITTTLNVYLRIYDLTKDWHNPINEEEGCIPVQVMPYQWGFFHFSKPLPSGLYQILAYDYGEDPKCNSHQLGYLLKGFTVQSDSDYYTLILAVGGMTSAVIAIIAVAFQYANGKSTIKTMTEDSHNNLLEMQKQREISTKALNLAQDEAKSKLRPWVSPVSIKATFIEFPDSESSAGTVPYDEGIILINKKLENRENAIISFDIVVKNTGTIPTIDAKYRYLQKENSFIRTDLNAQNPMKTVSIMPGEMDVMTIEIPLRTIDDGDYYVGLSVEYVVDGKILNSGIIWKLTYNNDESVDTWIS